MADYDDDPVFLDSRREAFLILLIWGLCLVWTVSYCYRFGYVQHERTAGEITQYLPMPKTWDREPASLTTPFALGIPDWVFWGITVPWFVCVLVSIWFCFVYMKDDDERRPVPPHEPEKTAQ